MLLGQRPGASGAQRQVELAVAPQHLTQNLGVPAAARHQLDDGHIVLQTKKLQGFDRPPVAVPGDLIFSADIALHRRLNLLSQRAERRALLGGGSQREQNQDRAEQGAHGDSPVVVIVPGSNHTGRALKVTRAAQPAVTRRRPG